MLGAEWRGQQSQSGALGQQQRHLRTWWKCKFSGPRPDLPTWKLRVAIGVVTSPVQGSCPPGGGRGKNVMGEACYPQFTRWRS